MQGKRVLLIDADAQASMTAALGNQYPDDCGIYPIKRVLTMAFAVYQATSPLTLCCTLLMTGKGNDYLADINAETEKMISRLVKEMSKQQGINEQLKAEN